MVANNWVFISELVVSSLLFTILSKWINCLYFHIKKKNRPTQEKISDQVIIPLLNSYDAQLWIMKQAPNWYAYIEFIYSLLQDTRQNWLKKGGMYSRYHQQAYHSWYKGNSWSLQTKNKRSREYKEKKNDKEKGTRDNFYQMVRNRKLEKKFRNILFQKKKNKKRKVKQLIHDDTRIENIKQEYEQEWKRYHAKYAEILKEIEEEKKKIETRFAKSMIKVTETIRKEKNIVEEEEKSKI